MTDEQKAHTPGPWRPDADHLQVFDANDCPVATIWMDTAAEGYEYVANARLIAAAPDLLALAKQYASECSECNGTGLKCVRDTYCGDADDQPCPDCADIRAVINKAEDRENGT